jgi:hypothetical protein
MIYNLKAKLVVNPFPLLLEEACFRNSQVAILTSGTTSSFGGKDGSKGFLLMLGQQ